MCAIAGIISPANHKQEQLNQMLDLMKHRGPDETGSLVDQHAAIGHNRLSIIDPKSKGLYPLVSNSQRYILTFNGEIFNYRELKRSLLHRYEFKTDMDSEVLLAAYEVWGKACLKRLRGMFAFAIWDRKENKLFAARDPFGIKPFYYRKNNISTDTNTVEFLFSSEIKPLLLNTERKPNDRIIAQYLTQGLYDHCQETFFEGIFKLDAAHYLEYQNGKLTTTAYWDLSHACPSQESASTLKENIAQTLQNCVDISLRADVPIGLNISGGFDSSLLSHLVMNSNEFTSGELHCFSQDYKDSRYSERSNIELNLKNLNTDVSYSYLSADQFIDTHQSLQWFQEEPYAGLPVAGYVGVYQAAAAQGITVLLDGNGLDEAAAGYKSYHSSHLAQLQQGDPSAFEKAREVYLHEWGTDYPIDSNALKTTKHLSQNMATDGTALSHHDLLNKELLESQANSLATDAYARINAMNFSTTRKRMLEDVLIKKIPRALRFNDRVSMAFSKELRVPYLNTDLFELLYSVPENLLFENFRPKGILRNIYQKVGNQKVLQAPKQHIQTPQSEWFKTQLNSWLQDTTHSLRFRNRNYFDNTAVSTHLKAITEEDSPISNSFYLWQMINLDTWFQQFIDSDNINTSAPEFGEILTEKSVPSACSA